MLYALLLGVVPLSVLAAAISVRLARRALAPLETLAADVSGRRPDQAWEPIVPSSQDAEVVRLADALNETGQRLTAALAAEREFAAYAAHALRMPLTRLAAAARSGTPPAGGALETLRRLVESLLVLLRTGPRLDEAGETVNVADVVRQVAAEHAASGRTFTVEAPDEALVRGDEELLVAALEHLVENALSYSAKGSPVHLSVAETGGDVTASVRDEGPGIPVEEIESIFRPFVRGATAGETDGSGLGLALVRRIATGHGGTARASLVGIGTCFELVLPVWRPR
jgi:signal transduction histidine kinase